MNCPKCGKKLSGDSRCKCGLDLSAEYITFLFGLNSTDYNGIQEQLQMIEAAAEAKRKKAEAEKLARQQKAEQERRAVETERARQQAAERRQKDAEPKLSMQQQIERDRKIIEAARKRQHLTEQEQQAVEERARQQQIERARQQKAEQERQAAEERARQQQIERARQQKAEQERKAAEAERARQQKAEQDRQAAEEQARQQQIEQARQAAEERARQQQIEEQRATQRTVISVLVFYWIATLLFSSAILWAESLYALSRWLPAITFLGLLLLTYIINRRMDKCISGELDESWNMYDVADFVFIIIEVACTVVLAICLIIYKIWEKGFLVLMFAYCFGAWTWFADRHLDCFSYLSKHDSARSRHVGEKVISTITLLLLGVALFFFATNQFLHVQDTEPAGEPIRSANDLEKPVDYYVCNRYGAYYLHEDGTVSAFGDENSGAEKASAWQNIKEIDASDMVVAGLHQDGTVELTGYRVINGNLDGLDDLDVSSWSDIKQVKADWVSVIGVRNDGTVVASPEDYYYFYGEDNEIIPLSQLENVDKLIFSEGKESRPVVLQNDGTVMLQFDFFDHAPQWTGIVDIAAVSSDWLFGLTESGQVLCDFTGLNESSYNFTAADFETWTDMTQISAGERHIIGLRKDGTVVAQGENSLGQCDIGKWTDVVEIRCTGCTTFGRKSDGTLLIAGYDYLAGKYHQIPDGEITETNKVLSMEAKCTAEGDWDTSIVARAGDEITFQITYINRLKNQMDNVMIRDILPSSIEYVAGTTVLYNSNYPEGVKIKDDTIATSGINIGSYSSGGSAYVRFVGRISNTPSASFLENWANVTVNKSVSGKASVLIRLTE